LSRVGRWQHRRSPRCRILLQGSDPVAGEGWAHRNTCVGGTVAGDVGLVGALAVAASAALVNGELIRIDRGGETAGGAVLGDHRGR